MQLPRESAAAQVRVRYGRYVARRLRRAGQEALMEGVVKTTAALKAADRAYEDTLELTEDAMADRDGADIDLDAGAQDARNRLAGRGVQAAQESPYIDVFPRGIGYYTAAPLDEQERRYKELRDRASAHLPKTDAVRTALVKSIDAGLKDWRDASAALDDARTEVAKASTALARATDAWVRQIERTYGALVAEVGRSAAEGFFPKARSATKAPAEKPADPPKT